MDTNRLMQSDHDDVERFRPRLFGIAYRMLSDVQEAEDLVQETFLRWHQAKHDDVISEEGWLVAVVTRLAIDRLRRAETERLRYVGTWLPEPIATGNVAPDHRAELASDLSMAFLVLLERLAPEERAAFLLREVFDAGYDEIARILDKTEPAVRQVVHRAKARVREGRSRFSPPAEKQAELLQRFLDALAADDKEGMLALFAPDATFTSDGGGKVYQSRTCSKDRSASRVCSSGSSTSTLGSSHTRSPSSMDSPRSVAITRARSGWRRSSRPTASAFSPCIAC